MKKHFTTFKKSFIYGSLICLCFLLIVYLVACINIHNGLKSIGDKAQNEYPGDRIEALISLVDSENHSLKEKDRAVWALGQFGDRRAIPILEKYYTSQPCDHEKNYVNMNLKKQ